MREIDENSLNVCSVYSFCCKSKKYNLKKSDELFRKVLSRVLKLGYIQCNIEIAIRRVCRCGECNGCKGHQCMKIYAIIHPVDRSLLEANE